MGVSVLSSLDDIQKQARDLGSSRRSPFGLPIPRTALPVVRFGFVAMPAAYGTQVQIVQFQARANWFFLATGVVLGFAGSGQAPGPGDVDFTIDIDRPLGKTSGYVEKDFDAVPYPIGSLQTGPIWPVEFRHRNLEIIRIKGTPIANVGLGATNFLTAALTGFEWAEGGYEGS